ncbi:MAG: response regulator [Treponemataceae bacterium]|nr:response regulator [Treponemataceae bacterium]
MFSLLSFYKELAVANRQMLKKNRRIVNMYNFRLLRILLAFTAGLLLLLTVLAYLPMVEYFSYVRYRVLFGSAFGVMFVLLLFSFVFSDRALGWTIPLLYGYIVLISSFSVVMNLVNATPMPYVVTVALMLIAPMMTIDGHLRIIVLEFVQLAAFVYVSWYFKATTLFVMDLVHCTMGTLAGMVMGFAFRSSYVGYIDLKEQELDRNVELLRAKSEAKSSIIANMSKEIRAPITTVLDLNEQILRESTERNVLAYAVDIKSAGKTLVALVNDMLTVSGGGAEKLTIASSEYRSENGGIGDCVPGSAQAADGGAGDLPVAAERGVSGGAFQAPAARILVVDDLKINLDVISALLKRMRVQVDTALSGQKALALVGKRSYHLIFLDHCMPGMDGIETLRAMKSLAGNQSAAAPCIALTANDSAGARDQYLAEGFADYLAKPVDYGALESLLAAYLPKDVLKCADGNEYDGGAAAPGGDDPFLRAYGSVAGINVAAALDFCGDRDVLEGAVHDFFDAIARQADAIEGYCRQKDIDNYRILVHGLKSSARLVGAERLSQDAAFLEQCAKDGNLEEIDARTPALLAAFRGLKAPLSQVLTSAGNPSAAAGTEQTAADAQPMDAGQFADALSALAECVEADDFSAAQDIARMVDAYRLPPDLDGRYADIRRAIFAADKAAALQLLR